MKLPGDEFRLTRDRLKSTIMLIIEVDRVNSRGVALFGRRLGSGDRILQRLFGCGQGSQ